MSLGVSTMEIKKVPCRNMKAAPSCYIWRVLRRCQYGPFPRMTGAVFLIWQVHGKKTGKDFKRFEPIPEEHKKKKKGEEAEHMRAYKNGEHLRPSKAEL